MKKYICVFFVFLKNEEKKYNVFYMYGGMYRVKLKIHSYFSHKRQLDRWYSYLTRPRPYQLSSSSHIYTFTLHQRACIACRIGCGSSSLSW